MSTLMALDPGFTATGYALFTVPRSRPSVLQEYAPLLLGSGSWTPPRASHEDRATWLVEQAAGTLAGHTGPYLVAVEVHQVARQYARHQGRDRSGKGYMNVEDVALNRELCGWLAGGLCVVARVIRVAAGTTPKVRKSGIIYDVWPTLLGKSNEHQRDAIHLGLTTLMDRRRTSCDS